MALLKKWKRSVTQWEFVIVHWLGMFLSCPLCRLAKLEATVFYEFHLEEAGHLLGGSSCIPQGKSIAVQSAAYAGGYEVLGVGQIRG